MSGIQKLYCLAALKGFLDAGIRQHVMPACAGMTRNVK
jgi:hypothetical protein